MKKEGNKINSQYSDFRKLDAIAVNIISVYPKVQQILTDKIPAPEVAEFFITNYCSFACPHCRCAQTHENKSSFINLKLYEKTLDDLLALGCMKIEFGGGGEPLEHPDITKIFRLLHDRNMRCGIITNGYALINNRSLMDEILSVADWMRISLDAVSDKSYQIIHGRKDLYYSKLKEEIKIFVTKAAENNSDFTRTRLGLKLIIQQHNKHELSQSIDEALEIGADYLQFKWLENHPFAIPKEERGTIDNLIYSLKDKIQNRMSVDFLAGYGGEIHNNANEPCLLSILHPLIDWDGKMYICAFFHHRKDSHLLGDLSVNSFKEVWNSPEHRIRIDQVNRQQCVPNCPLKRYNPIVEFIKQEAYRFHYI